MPKNKEFSLTELSKAERETYQYALDALNEELDEKIGRERPALEKFFRRKNVPPGKIEGLIRQHRAVLYDEVLTLFHQMGPEDLKPYREKAKAEIEAKKSSANKL